jgi:hypothetical protein
VKGRDIAGVLLTVAGAAAATACLASVSAGMRDVMQTDGGVCASGGPYVIAHQCSSADIRLIMVGIFGGLLSAGLYAGGTSALGRRASTSGLLAWAALFGLLGWNFLHEGLHPRGGSGTSYLLTGAMFELMALGGLIVLLLSLISDVRGAGRTSPVAASMRPLVRAAIPAGFPAPQPAGSFGWQQGGVPGPSAMAGPPARGAVLLRLGTWVFASLAGAGAGIALSAALISTLR